MGTPTDSKKCAQILTGKIEARDFKNKQKVIFPGPWRSSKWRYAPDQKSDELKIFSSPAVIKKINDSGYLAIVITNQPVVARNLCTEDELRIIHNKLGHGSGEK